jgi:hypothetical protein
MATEAGCHKVDGFADDIQAALDRSRSLLDTFAKELRD